jgi:hypothetical protein
MVPKFAGFDRAAGRVRSRIEVEHDLFTLQARELEGFPGVGLKLDIGSFVTFFEHLA